MLPLRFPLLASLSCAPLLVAAASAQVANVAPLGVASQSSQYTGWAPQYSHAYNAIDGNSNGSWYVSSCSCTAQATTDSWWRVDFGTRFEVVEVRLFNRTDCCASRLSNFRVTVEEAGVVQFSQDFYVGSGSVPTTGPEVIQLPAGTRATAVQVQLLGQNNDNNGFLTLAEVEVDARVRGVNYCGPAAANSTGSPATITAIGDVILGNNLGLGVVADNLPLNQFAYFLVSKNAGSVQPPASQGTLCLGGNIGRYNAQILNTHSGFAVGRVIDLTSLPVNPAVAALPGETWRFQAWYRDVNPMATSNFTDAVAVTVQ